MSITRNKNGIMSKESFCMILDDYKSMFDFTNEMNELFRKYQNKSDVHPPICTEIVVTLLEYIFKDEGKWIQYWIYELEFGKCYEDGYVQGKDKSIIPLKTAEDLYDLLVNNMKENGGE